MKLKTEFVLEKNAINQLNDFLKKYEYKNILLVYGFNSFKKNGIYDNVVNQIKTLNLNLFEVNQISPNPRTDDVERIAKAGIENNVDLILAIGGGSVIDAAKAALGLIGNQEIKNCWDLVTNNGMVSHKLIDLIAIPTIFGTASENNDNSVITNWNLKIKKAMTIKNSAPKLAILDTECLKTLSDYQLACVLFDAFNHNLEQYFTIDDFEWTNMFLINNMKLLLKYSPILLKDRNNYEAGSNLVWTCSMSLNEISGFKQKDQLWGMHTIEHALSGIYDISHGAGLAIITPSYIQNLVNMNPIYFNKTQRLSQELFHKESVEDFIKEITKFIKSLKLPLKWSDFKGIKSKGYLDFDAIIKHLEYTEKLPRDSFEIENYIRILKTINF